MKKQLTPLLLLLALSAGGCSLKTNDTHSPAVNATSSYTETIPFSQIKFDMVLVPGDPAHGIKPFYLGKTEVTWDEFMPWALCKDIADEKQRENLRDLMQRPSDPQWQVDRGFGMARRPALSMSQKSAELYCQWLSQQTGRKYRLPTEKEWERAYALGGNDPSKPLTQSEANRIAVWKNSALKTDSGLTMSSPVGSKAPNKLGIFDMAGNVAEWVAGDKKIIRGGYFDSDLQHLGALGTESEDQSIWNSNDPGETKSPWWFHDHVGVGMRVACDP